MTQSQFLTGLAIAAFIVLFGCLLEIKRLEWKQAKRRQGTRCGNCQQANKECYRYCIHCGQLNAYYDPGNFQEVFGRTLFEVRREFCDQGHPRASTPYCPHCGQQLN